MNMLNMNIILENISSRFIVDIFNHSLHNSQHSMKPCFFGTSDIIYFFINIMIQIKFLINKNEYCKHQKKYLIREELSNRFKSSKTYSYMPPLFGQFCGQNRRVLKGLRMAEETERMLKTLKIFLPNRKTCLSLFIFPTFIFCTRSNSLSLVYKLITI